MVATQRRFKRFESPFPKSLPPPLKGRFSHFTAPPARQLMGAFADSLEFSLLFPILKVN
jgi:hypothetical protein